MTKKKTTGEMLQVQPWDQRRETDLMYTGRALVACNLPLKPVKIKVLQKNGTVVQKFASKYVRESGPFRVKILSDEDYGVPYGKDRLFLYWLITNAVRTASPTIYYPSVLKLLEEGLGLAYGKTNREWLRGAVDRIMNSTIFLEYDNGTVHGIEKDNVLRRVVGALDPKHPKRGAYTECYFELSTDFFRELVKDARAIPFDMEVIRRLGENYGAMDLYVWWNRKVWTLRKESHPYCYIGLDSLKAQFSGSLEMPLKKFKQQMKSRVTEVNRVLQDVYGIDPKLEIVKNQICFRVVTPPMVHSEVERKSPAIAPTDKPREEPQEQSDMGNHMREFISVLMGGKKLSTGDHG